VLHTLVYTVSDSVVIALPSHLPKTASGELERELMCKAPPPTSFETGSRHSALSLGSCTRDRLDRFSVTGACARYRVGITAGGLRDKPTPVTAGSCAKKGTSGQAREEEAAGVCRCTVSYQ